jgi:alpha-tubulin suppressor-like RCC1 family protein
VPKEQKIVPGAGFRLQEIDEIPLVKSIDWGSENCCFVDQKHRVFTVGKNRYGKTGLAASVPDKEPS